MSCLIVPKRSFLPFLVLIGFLDTSSLSSAARPQSDLGAGEQADDPVRRAILFKDPFPRNVTELRQRLRELGGTLNSHLVANGGHEHPVAPARVMFMSFETYSGPEPGGRVEEGDLFLGYFLVRQGNQIVVSGNFVELIAWDRTKRVFNFWELTDGKWQFRGDSNDVLENVTSVNMGLPSPTFKFVRDSPDGTPVLRCSGCHTLGSPIMKELEPPHNDWWTSEHKLPLSGFQLGTDASRLFETARDASNLARHVSNGIDRLIAARGTTQGRKHLLRSLFSTMEMNLLSDRLPFTTRVQNGAAVEIPAAFFADLRLAGQAPPIRVSVDVYQQALAKVQSRFPTAVATTSRETRHAFLIPARSHIDNRFIDALIEDGVIDDEFVADVLSVDMTTPVYSKTRSVLIKFVSEAVEGPDELREHLIKELRNAPAGDRAASELLKNLTDPARTMAAHRAAAAAYLEACAAAASDPVTIEAWLRIANQRRQAIDDAETALHPDGTITEKGFREVFPMQQPSAPLRLNSGTCRAELQS